MTDHGPFNVLFMSIALPVVFKWLETALAYAPKYENRPLQS